MDTLEAFMTGLDKQQPDWWITFADGQDKEHYIRKTWSYDGHAESAEQIDRARNSMRRTVASRLMVGARAAITAGLVKSVEA